MNKKLNLAGIIILFSLIPFTVFSQPQGEKKFQVKPALLVIDIQKAYLEGMDPRERETSMMNINYYIQLFRNHGCPIIRVYHYSKQFGPEQGTDQFEFPSTVLIKPDDPKVIKTYGDGFNKTDLDRILKEKGCNTVFLCGLSSVGCVLATWVGAQNYDYKAFMIKDAIMSHNEVYTSNIEAMFDAVGPEIITLVLDGTGK
jgi:nicotinamidase-related amidase